VVYRTCRRENKGRNIELIIEKGMGKYKGGDHPTDAGKNLKKCRSFFLFVVFFGLLGGGALFGGGLGFFGFGRGVGRG